MKTTRAILLAFSFCFAPLFLGACSSGNDVGAPCRGDRDCPSNHCCDSDKCGGGMCTYSCKSDVDCPPGTACEHNTCFVGCRDDYDCAPNQKCKHDRVCEFD